jgi:hypothetical protein
VIERKKDHDAGENVKQDIGNPVPQGIQSPEFIVYCVTQHPDGLVSIGLFVCEDSLDSLPIQIPDRGILINHPVIPIRKLISQ